MRTDAWVWAVRLYAPRYQFLMLTFSHSRVMTITAIMISLRGCVCVPVIVCVCVCGGCMCWLLRCFPGEEVGTVLPDGHQTQGHEHVQWVRGLAFAPQESIVASPRHSGCDGTSQPLTSLSRQAILRDGSHHLATACDCQLIPGAGVQGQGNSNAGKEQGHGYGTCARKVPGLQRERRVRGV